MSDWKSLLGQIAPTVATALGGPLAGGAVSFLANKVLGPDAPKDHDSAVNAIQQAVLGGDPKMLLAIKQADQEYQEHLQQIGVDLEKLSVENTKDARASFAGIKFVPQMVLSALFIGGYFGVLYMVSAGTIKVPDAYRDIFNQTLGTLLAIVSLVCNFWFGSTHSSQRKDDTLARAALED